MQKEKKSLRTYLELLKFNNNLFSGIASPYFKNIRFTLLFVFAVFFFGIYSFISVPRNLNPEVNIPIVTISAFFPGASPKDVESLVTIPLENQIKKIDGVSTYRSSSSENLSLLIVEFIAGTDPKQARNEVRSAADGVVLPSEIKKPEIKELDFENIPVWTFSLVKEGNSDTASLMRLSKRLKKNLEKLATIERIELTGLEKQSIQLILKPELLKSCRIDINQISQAIKSSLVSFPGGVVETSDNSFTVNLEKTSSNLSKIREINLDLPCGEFILGDIAEISYYPEKNEYYNLISENGGKPHPAVKFAVYKTKDSRVDRAVSTVRKEVEKEIAVYKNTYKIISLIDYDEQINKQFSELTENFLQTLFLVFIVMFIFYGLRQALVASLAIPFPVLITFIAMQALGISLNFISIFSLLIALGLFVDNAVVIIEAYTSYYKTKKFTPLETALLVYKDFKIPLFSINLVTVWAFLPLLIAGGIIGEFIKPLPIIVSVSMFASVLTAFAFTLTSMMVLTRFHLPYRLKFLIGLLSAILLLILGFLIIPKSSLFLVTYLIFILLLFVYFRLRKMIFQLGKNFFRKFHKFRKTFHFSKNVANEGLISLSFISDNYRKLLTYIIIQKKARIKFLILIGLFCFLTYLLLPFGALVNEFFPKTDQEELYLQVELPTGTKKAKSSEEMQDLFEKVRKINGIDYILGEVGVRFSSGVGFGRSADNIFLYTLVLEKKGLRKENSIETAKKIRELFKDYNQGKLSVLEITGGPPAGADVSLSLLGDDLGKLNNYADNLISYLASVPGVNNPEKSIKETNSRLSFEVDPSKLKKYKISELAIGSALRNFITGQNLATLRFEEEDEEEIIFKVSHDFLTPADISLIEVSTPSGTVPVSELGKFTLKENPQVISREEGKRTLAVNAQVLPGYSASTINKNLLSYANQKLGLSQNYEIKSGGANEENTKSVQSIILAMGLSAILILITMVIQLGSFRKALLVMLVIPLAVSGVFFWFSLTGTPLSFPALIGILALFGVVIANSIVIVDKINQNLASGISQNEALIDAGASRIEPILLTSISSMVGLIPITLSDPLWRGLGGAIIAGLSVSGILMLIVIPIAYYYFYPQKR